MKTNLRSSNLWFVFILCLPLSICAQTAIITGKVFDNASRSSLPGANVFLKSALSTGTVTDIDGIFILNAVEAGEKTVVVSFLGYQSKEQTITGVDGESYELEFFLEPAALLGKEVVVTAQLLGQSKAINQQLNSEAIVNIVSSDKIQELPDVNAAEAIARLPGVAINRSGGEGQKVVIRGIGAQVCGYFSQWCTLALQFRYRPFGRFIDDFSGNVRWN